MKTITLTCHLCSKTFTRRLVDYNRNVERGEVILCSRKCLSQYANKQKTKESYKNCHLHLNPANRKDEYSPFKYYLGQCRKRKRTGKQGSDIDINLSYLKELWESQNGICPYTQIKMILPETTSSNATIHSFDKASLDRIDSSKGYIKGNVEFVCFFINFAKNNHNKQDVIDFLRRIKLADATRLALANSQP